MQEWSYTGDRRPFAPDIMDVCRVPGTRVVSESEQRVVVRVPRNIIATAWQHPPFDATPDPLLSPYQQEAEQFLGRLHSGYLALPVGTGKTRILCRLGAPDATSDDGRFTLIVAPKALSGTWRDELQAMGYLHEGPDVRWTQLRSRRKDDAYDLTKFGLLKDAKWVFIHPEILESWKGMLAGRIRKIIVDEAHRDFRSYRSNRTEALGVLAATNEHITYKAKSDGYEWRGARVYAASGTPFLNRASDAYPILSILEPNGWGSPLDFRERYCGATQDIHWADAKEANPERLLELRERFSTIGYHRSRKQLGIQLPPLIWNTITCDASQRLRDESIAFLGADPVSIVEMLLEGRNLSDSTLGHMTRLAQLASRDKIPMVADFVKGLAEQGERVLVFTNYRATVEALFAAIGKHCVTVATYGGGHVSDGGDAIRKFRAVDGRVLISTFPVLGAGVNLQEIGHVVHHDLSWEPSVHVQGTARAWRRGRLDTVCAYLAFAQHSLDELLARALARKYSMISTLDVAFDLDDYKGLHALRDAVSKQDVQSWVDAIVRGAQ